MHTTGSSSAKAAGKENKPMAAIQRSKHVSWSYNFCQKTNFESPLSKRTRSFVESPFRTSETRNRVSGEPGGLERAQDRDFPSASQPTECVAEVPAINFITPQKKPQGRDLLQPCTASRTQKHSDSLHLSGDKALYRTQSKQKTFTPERFKVSQTSRSGESRKTAAAGLKIISQKVLEVVRQAGTTSYTEVANTVSKNIDELCQLDSDSFGSDKQAKQEKNMRRRVYDSLNVLLAVGVLEKGSGKRVFCSQGASDCQSPGKQIRKSLAAQTQMLASSRHRLHAK